MDLAPLVVAASLVAACDRHTQVTAEPAPDAATATSSSATSPASAGVSARAAAPASSAAGPAPLRAVSVGAAQTVVIWTRPRKPPRSSEPTETTRFLRADGTVAATRRGVYLVAGDRLYRWASRARTSASERCEPPERNVFPRRVLHDAALVPVSGGKPIEILGFAAPDGNGILPEEETRSPVASLGDAVFVRSDSAGFGCGAHPLYAAAIHVARVRGDGTAEAIPIAELRAGAEARIDDALPLLNQGASPDAESLDGPAKRDEIEVTMTFPTFEATGPRWIAQYTTHATWAGSDGSWGGYARSVRLDLPGLPPRLADLAAVPDAAVRYASAHPDEEVRGVSAGAVDVPR